MRGERPVVTIDSEKKFAGRQGYHRVPNPDTDLPYDAIAYRDPDAIVIRVRRSRHSPGKYDMWEDFFYEDVGILKSPPHAGMDQPRALGALCLEPGLPAVPAP